MIDDDLDILTLQKEFLSGEGFEVDVVANGTDAVSLSKEKIFELALIDVILPDMMGTQLLTELTDHPPIKMRKIMFTGNATFDNVLEALNAGAHAFIMKPIKPEELIRTMKEQLQKRDEETLLTGKKISAFIEQNKSDFVKTVRDALNSLWRESTTNSTIFQLGAEESIRDPKVFAERLKAFFDVGAESILLNIIKDLEDLETPARDNEGA